MKKNLKALVSAIWIFLIMVLVVGCDNVPTYKINFETNGGNEITSVEVELESFELPSDPVREGYEFKGWYVDEDFESEFTSLLEVSDVPTEITLYAKWEINAYTVQFSLEPNEEAIYTYQGEYNSAVSFRDYIARVYQTTTHLDALYNELSTFVRTQKPSEGLAAAMMTGGATGVTKYLNDNCGLALQYSEIANVVNQILQTIASAGGNITNEVVAQLTPLLALGLQYTSSRLETNQAIYNAYSNNAYNPVKEGYAFGGWHYLDDGNELEFTGTVPGIDGKTINVYPKWIKILDTPLNLQVNDTLLTWDEVLGADKYEIYIDDELVTTVSTNQYTIPPIYTSGDIEVRAINDTTYSYETTSVVDNETKLSATYNINSEKSNAYSYLNINTGADEVTAVGDYYYKVGNDTFVFYTGVTYTFASTVVFSDISNNLATANGNVLEIGNVTGDFTFKAGETQYNGHVKPLITSFGKGESLSSTDDLNNSLYLNKVASLITIGTGIKGANDENTNGYKFDLEIIATGGKKLTNTELSYTFYDPSDLTTALSLSDVAEYDEETDTFYFKEAGKTYTVVITPDAGSYAVPNAHNDTYQVTFTFKTNSGINVTTNEELKAAYADLSVSEINILANIKAALSDNQWEDALHTRPVNKYDSDLAAGQVNGDIYSRVVESDATDSITINGNYFTIDGRELPFTDIYAINNVSNISGYEIANVQIAIFKYRGSSNGVATYNNLMVIGNTETPSVNFSGSSSEVLSATELMNRNSGGYSGLMARDSAKMVINNSIITQTTIAVYASDHAWATIDQSYIDDSWANSVYGHGIDKLVLTRSKIGSSGGAALHVQDKYLDVNPIVEISADTEINNLVSGEEAWFKAYNMEIVALGLKSQLETLVSPMNYTVLKTEDVNGRQTEKFNFPFLFLDKTNDTSGTADLQGVELTLQGMPALNSLPGNEAYPDGLFVQLSEQYVPIKLYLVGEETIPGEGAAKFIVQLFPVEKEAAE